MHLIPSTRAFEGCRACVHLESVLLYAFHSILASLSCFCVDQCPCSLCLLIQMPFSTSVAALVMQSCHVLAKLAHTTTQPHQRLFLIVFVFLCDFCLPKRMVHTTLCLCLSTAKYATGELAQQVMAHLESCLGSDAYLPVHMKVIGQIRKARLERKQKRKLAAVLDPEVCCAWMSCHAMSCLER